MGAADLRWTHGLQRGDDRHRCDAARPAADQPGRLGAAASLRHRSLMRMGDDASVFRTTVRIPTASGDDLEAWVYQPDGHGPHPAVVMAHGFAGVKAGGLEPFAERFCREGFLATSTVPEKRPRLDAEAPCDPTDIVDGHIALGPLDRAEIRAVDAALVR